MGPNTTPIDAHGFHGLLSPLTLPPHRPLVLLLLFILSCGFAPLSPAGDPPDQARSTFRTLAPNIQSHDASHPLDPALEMLQSCRSEFAAVIDYEARVIQQQRVARTLLPEENIHAKFRQQPFSVYYKWNAPEAGRESIYVEGREDDLILTHPPGLKRRFIGVQRIDPDNPETRKEHCTSLRDAGIGRLIDKLLLLWEYERRYRETEVEITHVKVNGRPSYLIHAIHPRPDDGKFMYHTVKVYVDKELSLPIRWEAYGYPEVSGREAGDLLECRTYLELRFNVGLKDEDFSTANPAYEFRRF